MEKEEIKKLIKELGVDNVSKIYIEGQKSMKEHYEPAPKTMEELNKLALTMTKFEGGLNLITEVVGRIEDKLDKHTDKEDVWTKEADNKYASKSLHAEVTNLKDTLEKRQYEWLKYTIAVLVSVLLTVIVYNKLNL